MQQAVPSRRSADRPLTGFVRGRYVNRTSHAFYGGEAVFRVGSKLNHSCAPNTVWRTWGRAGHAHVALRPVACGDEVSTSYLDVGCAMRQGLWSTAARRRLL
jgi:hypothetical protein